MEAVSKDKYDKLRKLAWNMYTSMQYLSTDASNVRIIAILSKFSFIAL